MTDFIEHITHEFALPLQNPVLIFSLILFIILLSPILLRKLNIPGIIGLIIAGVIIGPHGLNILEKNSAINLFSTIGLLYIMFIAGLELDMNEFKVNRNKSLLFGLFTFAIPLSVGFPVCYYLLGFDFDASFLTASMFATHTLVAYPIVSKLGVSKNQAVAVTVGGTILTDTAVLIILAVIIGKSQGNLTQEFWIRLGISLLVFSAIMFLIIPRIAQWFFKKLESEKHSHYIFVLSVVFFAAFLAEVAGIEPIIGAFVAGLALNKLIPQSSALMNRIEFIGNSLFIPFFLISVGMIVNVSVLAQGPTALIIAGALTTVAIFGKWLAAFFTQIVFKYSKAQRQLIFGLSSAHAAATLAVILVGYEAKILDENILNGTIVLILITCIVASFATEQAAKKIIVESDGLPTELLQANNRKNENILLPIANFLNIEKTLEFVTLIKEKKSTTPISVLSVVSNDNDAETNILKARAKLEEFTKQASASETKVNVITTIDYNAASGISRISREVMADIIVIGWPSRSDFIDKLMGEKFDSILNNTDKTLFVCHFAQPLPLTKRILIAIPPLAEHENGFSLWLTKVAQLAQELSASIQLYCNEATQKAVEFLFENAKLSATLRTQILTEWEDFLIISKDIQKDDLIVLASARKGSTSYISQLENMPSKLAKHFTTNNRIIVYPHQNLDVVEIERFSDISGEPLSKGIEAVQKIGKGIGSIFKKKE
ncbi:MAG: cation:proton antiporter [Chitinophagales bacterium]|nr:cation:proton antiporter [Chitinophagales bacterium]MCO5279604.1 cation:proton antiporter [Chitinophagales bacterium]OJV24177.1 MAG: sodium:proton antiporter [Bacteroidetes bacterium 37-13]HRN94035.1 cation:proton antiporter [Chitinophagales bacterium]HRP40053.1 cation:proton antiporter [Chitinophagales bacterium]